ncbi:MAG: hypothetical protein IJ882_05405, partial [Paludibacteraceae bacterium]|nr:hypothetical protein [Paludibacteraceae bacterium]
LAADEVKNLCVTHNDSLFLNSAAKVLQKLHIRKYLSKKNEVNRILFYIEGTIMTLGACT